MRIARDRTPAPPPPREGPGLGDADPGREPNRLSGLLSLPVYLDAVASWCARFLSRTLGRTMHAAAVALVLFVGAAAAYVVDHPVVGTVAAMLGLAALGRRALEGLHDWRRLKRAVARRRRPNSRHLPVRDALRRLGLDDALIKEVLARAGEKELTIAELDQNNRLLSQIGPIPLFADTLIGRESFRKRFRNRTRIVLAFGTLAVRKDYSLVRRFANEVRVLDALEDLDEVPTLLNVDARGRVAYQTFFPGRDLGSMLADAGASVSAQYQLGKKFKRSREPTDCALRDDVVRAVQRTVDHKFIAAIQRLIVEVHQRGVLVRDVKHGNVLVCDEGPRLCDFDLSHVFGKNDATSTRLRAAERERFNYLFGGHLLTPAGFRRALASWIARNPDLPYPGVYFGKGYRFGDRLTAEGGTGKWLLIRRLLPQFSGGCVVDVSCGTGVPLLEMLRAGASKVLAHEPDERLAELASLHHRFFEFVDNRDYDFTVTRERFESERQNALLDGVDEIALVTALPHPCPSGGGAWERAIELIGRHATRIRHVAIECAGERQQLVNPNLRAPAVEVVTRCLTRLGFTGQRTVRLRFGPNLLVMGRREKIHGRSV